MVTPEVDLTICTGSRGQPASAGITFGRRKIVLHFSIELLQDKESLLLFPVFIHQAFSVEVVFDARKRSPRTAKILQDPGRGSFKKRYALEHCDLMLVEVFLIFLRPTCSRVAMVPEEGVSPKLAHDKRLVEWRGPRNRVRVGRAMDVPADVFVVSQDIEFAGNGIVDANRDVVAGNDLFRLESCRYQARGVRCMRLLDELP